MSTCVFKNNIAARLFSGENGISVYEAFVLTTRFTLNTKCLSGDQ